MLNNSMVVMSTLKDTRNPQFFLPSITPQFLLHPITLVLKIIHPLNATILPPSLFVVVLNNSMVVMSVVVVSLQISNSWFASNMLTMLMFATSMLIPLLNHMNPWFSPVLSKIGDDDTMLEINGNSSFCRHNMAMAMRVFHGGPWRPLFG